MLDVLFGRLKASLVAWTSFIGPRDKIIAIFDQNNILKNFSCKFI
jgi:hypothetical protein